MARLYPSSDAVWTTPQTIVTLTDTEIVMTPEWVGKLILIDSPTNVVMTVPDDIALNIGDRIDFIQISEGQLEFHNEGTWYPYNVYSTDWLTTRYYNSACSYIVKDQGIFIVVGDLLS